MATTYAAEVSAQQTTPAGKSSGAYTGGRLRRWRATITLASQASGDDVVLARIPAGHTFAFGIINPGVALGGTATVAIGVSGATGKYRAAAIDNATGPKLFGLAAAVDDAPLGGTGEEVLLTVGAASLPSSGTLVVDLYYSAP